ncbi:MAG: hypothetical protein ACM3XM_05315 [Mycobacterium leprae]
MEQVEGNQLYAGMGYAMVANDDDTAIMEFANPEACQLAYAIQRTLKRHALCTNCLEPFDGKQSLLVRRIEPIPLTVLTRCVDGEARVEFRDRSGVKLDKPDAIQAGGIKPGCLDMIEDIALHTMRTLRAYFGPAEGLALKLLFGRTASGETLLQVIDPDDCNLGSKDYAALCGQLGGQKE